MSHISNLDVVFLLAMAACVVIGPILLVAAAVLLAVPSLRRHPRSRRVAPWLLGTAAVLCLAAAPIWSELVPEMFDDLTAPLRLRARTRHPSHPTTYNGITFPPGSTVMLTSGIGGAVESATVPVPTTVLGVPLIGSFEINKLQDRPGISGATLAAAAEVYGIPCAPGPFERTDDWLTCTLSRDHEVMGHPLASGTNIEIDVAPEGQVAWLARGTLARPELLYGIAWPAGTVIGGVSQSPASMAQLPGPPAGRVDMCAPAGTVVPTPWAEMHGPAMFEVNGAETYLWRGCSSLVPDSSEGGFIQAGPNRYDSGTREDSSAEWRWVDWIDPDPAPP